MSKQLNDEGTQAPVKSTLFSDFAPATYEEWYDATVKSLKGKPFERLVSKTYEGIALQPMYRQEDVADLPYLDSLPGEFPYLRGTKPLGYIQEPWLVAQELAYGSPQEFNAALRHDLERGQTAVNMILDYPTRNGLDPDQSEPGIVGQGGLSLASVTDMADALADIDLVQTPIFIRAGSSTMAILALLAAHAQKLGIETAVLHGSLEFDPLGELARRGTLTIPLTEAYDEIAQSLRWSIDHAPQLAIITVHGYPYHSAGGSAVQELAFSLATAVAYLREMGDRGLSVDEVAPRIQFALGLGGDLFMELAKIRAARLLWAQIVQAFGGGEEAQKLTLHGRTARRNKTAIDPYVNMLRVTTEAFAAAAGGVDSLHVAPFDEETALPDEFSRRVARNVQLILQEEANMTRLIDPAGGSWYVEYLTDQVAKKSWALFQEVEQLGGMAVALEAGFPQGQCATTAVARSRNLAKRKDVLVGTNMYVNLEEPALAEDDIDYEALFKERKWQLIEHRQRYGKRTLESGGDMVALIKAARSGASINQLLSNIRSNAAGPSVKPLTIQRLAQPFEKLRANAAAYTKKHGRRPQIFLANMGSLRQHKARADFSRAFFEVGGFEIISPAGFATTQEAAEAALVTEATAVVICSTDDTYPEIVPPLVQQIKEARPQTAVVLAGYPKDQIEAHKAAGIDDFIFLGADCYTVNQMLQGRLT